MLTWEEARASIYPLPSATVAVDLDWLVLNEPCVACGEDAQTAYRGRAIHAICAIELAFYVELVKRGERPPVMLPTLALDAGSADALELSVGR